MCDFQLKVVLRPCGDEWLAELSLDGDFFGLEFAFYLVRNGVRVSSNWYSQDRISKFENSGVAGFYQARAFVRAVGGSSESVTIIDSDVFVQEGPPYDLRCWNGTPVFECDASVDGAGLSLKDGIHRFRLDNGYLDFLISGSDALAVSGEAVLVCFSGAISSRSGASAPFFSGAKLANSLGVPIISVADPALGRSSLLKLGWYAGYDGFVSVPSVIAGILDRFFKEYSLPLVFFGGSGGGFASIAVMLKMMSSRVSAFVWNPQTSISKYESSAVDQFVKLCFPDLDRSKGVGAGLAKLGVLHDLSEHFVGETRPLLYIQSQSDWHLHDHALPFLEKVGEERIVSERVRMYGRNLAFWVGDWGVGHAVPNAELIELALRGLLEGREVVDIALQLDKLNGD